MGAFVIFDILKAPPGYKKNRRKAKRKIRLHISTLPTPALPGSGIRVFLSQEFNEFSAPLVFLFV